MKGAFGNEGALPLLSREASLTGTTPLA
jgi:hypothetical protein